MEKNTHHHHNNNNEQQQKEVREEDFVFVQKNWRIYAQELQYEQASAMVNELIMH